MLLHSRVDKRLSGFVWLHIILRKQTSASLAGCTWLKFLSCLTTVIIDLDGGCFCGLIRYSIKLESPDEARMSICHCKNCKVSVDLLSCRSSRIEANTCLYRSLPVQHLGSLQRSLVKPSLSTVASQSYTKTITALGRFFTGSSAVYVARAFLSTQSMRGITPIYFTGLSIIPKPCHQRVNSSANKERHGSQRYQVSCRVQCA